MEHVALWTFGQGVDQNTGRKSTADLRAYGRFRLLMMPLRHCIDPHSPGDKRWSFTLSEGASLLEDYYNKHARWPATNV